MDVLRFLFPVPKEDSKRVMTFANEGDFISFRHHVFAKTSHKSVELAEVGPRFDMKRAPPPFLPSPSDRSLLALTLVLHHRLSPLASRIAYEIRQGTIEQTEADLEWVLRTYQRTARKKRIL
jgi:U3 small nucleolar ribonucleoprotein protein IMP4